MPFFATRNFYEEYSKFLSIQKGDNFKYELLYSCLLNKFSTAFEAGFCFLLSSWILSGILVLFLLLLHLLLLSPIVPACCNSSCLADCMVCACLFVRVNSLLYFVHFLILLLVLCRSPPIYCLVVVVLVVIFKFFLHSPR